MATAITTVRASRSSWTTPRMLRAFRGTLLLLNLCVLLALWSLLDEERVALHSLQTDAVPAMAAADRMRVAMAGMEASAARELGSARAVSEADRDSYAAHRAQAVRAILDAAEETHDAASAQRTSIDTLQLGLGTYETTLQRARDLATLDRRTALAAFASAAVRMEKDLQPEAARLERAADGRQAAALAQEEHRSAVERIALEVCGVALLAALLVSQLQLARRTRRTLNVPLLAATLMAGTFAVHTAVSLRHLQGTLRTTIAGNSDAAHALGLAHVYGALADAERSRLRLGGESAATVRSRFTDDADRVAQLPASLTGDQLLAALREGRSVAGFEGQLALAAAPPDARGQREGVLDAVAIWQRFRKAAEGSDTRSAAAQDGEPQQAADFTAFEGAVDRAEAAAHADFLNSVEATTHDLTSFEVQSGVAVALVALLVVAGFAPRIREYRA